MNLKIEKFKLKALKINKLNNSNKLINKYGISSIRNEFRFLFLICNLFCFVIVAFVYYFFQSNSFFQFFVLSYVSFFLIYLNYLYCNFNNLNKYKKIIDIHKKPLMNKIKIIKIRFFSYNLIFTYIFVLFFDSFIYNYENLNILLISIFFIPIITFVFYFKYLNDYKKSINFTKEDFSFLQNALSKESIENDFKHFNSISEIQKLEKFIKNDLNIHEYQYYIDYLKIKSLGYKNLYEFKESIIKKEFKTKHKKHLMNI